MNPLSSGSVPVEIIQEIFSWSVPETPDDNVRLVHWRRTTPNHPTNSPLLLCHVCKWWRAIAISSPALWTTISVVVRLGVASPTPELASLWLSRSGALPLNLSLYQQNESTANCIAAGHVLDVFKQYSSQWGDIRLELFGDCYGQLLTPDERVAPLLRRFRLEASDQEGTDFFKIFCHAPRLTDLQVSTIPSLDLIGTSIIPIPWQQLTYLSLEYVPSIGAALHVLQMCLGLRSCKMKVDSVRGVLPYDKCYFPTLHTLSINLDHSSLSTFFDQLYLPQLADFTIFVRGPLEQYSWAQAPFETFLTRSNCQIRRLEIHDTGLSGVEFAACILHSSLQSLNDLIIDDRKYWTWDPFVNGVVLEMMTTPSFRYHKNTGGSANLMMDVRGTEQVACLLPVLESLTIRGSCFLALDGMFADMVESRWRDCEQGVARFKVVEVEMPIDHPEDTRRLVEFQGEGLKVVFPQY